MAQVRIPGRNDAAAKFTLASGETGYVLANVDSDPFGNIVGESPFNFASVTIATLTTATALIVSAQGYTGS